MKIEDFEKTSNSIQEKLGKENSGLILNDLLTLKNENELSNKLIEKKDEEISSLKQKYNNLLEVNASLFQQTGSKIEDDRKKESKNNMTEDEDTPKVFNFKDCFDEKGRFKK